MFIYQFENDVKMYGTETLSSISSVSCGFENDVKMYGTETLSSSIHSSCPFENDVKMYGTETKVVACVDNHCLRMM